MSASVPWSVNAVEPEAWAAAREAARRSGMSVGEWLEAAIRENAEDTRVRRGRRRAAPPPDDRLEDIAEQLDELIGLAPDLAQTSQQSARVNEGIHRSLNALNERIERVEPAIGPRQRGHSPLAQRAQRAHRIPDGGRTHRAEGAGAVADGDRAPRQATGGAPPCRARGPTGA